MDSNKRTAFRYSRTVKWITAFCLTIILATTTMVLTHGDYTFKSSGVEVVYWVILALAMLLVLAISGYYGLRAPRYYILSAEGLYIKFFVGSIYYDSKSFEITSNIPAEEIKGSIRVWGSGGYFGYIGKFKVPRVGICQFYVTNKRDNLIRIVNRSKGKRTYISQ